MSGRVSRFAVNDRVWACEFSTKEIPGSKATYVPNRDGMLVYERWSRATVVLTDPDVNLVRVRFDGAVETMNYPMDSVLVMPLSTLDMMAEAAE